MLQNVQLYVLSDLWQSEAKQNEGFSAVYSKYSFLKNIRLIEITRQTPMELSR